MVVFVVHLIDCIDYCHVSRRNFDDNIIGFIIRLTTEVDLSFA